jgi:hypothetical protein
MVSTNEPAPLDSILAKAYCSPLLHIALLFLPEKVRGQCTTAGGLVPPADGVCPHYSPIDSCVNPAAIFRVMLGQTAMEWGRLLWK